MRARACTGDTPCETRLLVPRGRAGPLSSPILSTYRRSSYHKRPLVNGETTFCYFTRDVIPANFTATEFDWYPAPGTNTAARVSSVARNFLIRKLDFVVPRDRKPDNALIISGDESVIQGGDGECNCAVTLNVWPSSRFGVIYFVILLCDLLFATPSVKRRADCDWSGDAEFRG